MEYPARRRRGSALSLGIGLRPDNNKQASGAAAGASAAPPGPASLLGPAVAAGFVIGPRSRGPASLLGPGGHCRSRGGGLLRRLQARSPTALTACRRGGGHGAALARGSAAVGALRLPRGAQAQACSRPVMRHARGGVARVSAADLRDGHARPLRPRLRPASGQRCPLPPLRCRRGASSVGPAGGSASGKAWARRAGPTGRRRQEPMRAGPGPHGHMGRRCEAGAGTAGVGQGWRAGRQSGPDGRGERQLSGVTRQV